MLTFPYAELPTYQFKACRLRELKLGEAIQIGRMPPLLEAQLTAFLGFILEDKDLPLSLTIQERYYLLMLYRTCQKDSNLALEGDYSAYFIQSAQRLSWYQQQQSDQLLVTQLTGQQAEVLEELCEDLLDWTLGAMALQCQQIESLDHWPTLPTSATREQTAQIMRERIAILEAMPDSEFDQLYAEYNYLNEQFHYLVKTGFDAQGIVIYGGADDAPVRFRVLTCMGQFSQFMAKHMAETRTEPSDTLQYEHDGSP